MQAGDLAVAIGSAPVWGGLLQGLGSRRPPTAGWWVGTVLAVSGGMLMSASARSWTFLPCR